MLKDRSLRDGLEHFVLNIDRWRAEAARLRSESEAIDEVSEERLVAIEKTSGEIYQEIEAFNAKVAEIGQQSAAAAGELAEVGEALHLLLLEITEIGTRLYSTRSKLSPT